MTKITVHNKINPQYREVHIDGAHGGISSRGYINLSFYAERYPLPKSSEITLDDKGLISQIKNSTDSKTGLLREFEFGIYMDVNTAQEIADYLQSKINEFKKLK